MRTSRMMRMTRLAMVVIAGIAFCMGSSLVPGVQAAKPLEGITLSVLVVSDPEIMYLRPFLAEFEKKTGAKVVFEGYGHDEMREKMVMDFVGKTGAYDICTADTIWVGEFAPNLVSLGDLIVRDAPEVALDDYFPRYLETFNWEGKQIALPFNTYITFMCYRKDLFDEAGVAPATNWEEQRTVADKLTQDIDGDGKTDIYGHALNLKRGDPIAQAYWEYIWNFGGASFDTEMRPLFNSTEALEVVEYWISMLPYCPPEVFEYAWFERGEAYAQGRVAMIIAWNPRFGLFEDPKLSKVVDKSRWAMWPRKKGIEQPIPTVGAYSWGINADSKNIEAAWEFIKWANSPDVQRRYCAVGGAPVRTSSIRDPELVKKFPWFPMLEEAAPLTFKDVRPRIPELAEIHEIIGLLLSEAVTGAKSPKEALDAAQEEIGALMRKAGYFK